MAKISIYLAGPLFGIADRHHNLLLAQELEKLGYTVILPQKEALKFFNGERFDLKGISKDCKRQSMENDVVVANIDGPDADSGTALEVGIALSRASIANKPKVICIRTDFRTNREQEIGINGMFEFADRVIYMPAFTSSLKEITEFYKGLAKKIDNAIKELAVRK
ncbi:unnamed protein product [marine sediment metagenome]|uniref:Nucleoside 2-deoxyribosyltransferase n=1 Tax=marine sediment metagenome TaxID=412755 RepID=X0UWB7_9ZZZZ